MPSPIRKTLWYLRRPSLYAHAMRKAYAALFHCKDQEDANARANAWCSQRAVGTQSAIAAITSSKEFESFDTQFAGILEQSEKIAATCPVKMGGRGNLDLLYQLTEYIQARRVIETGVAYGWSSLAFLLSLKNRNGFLVSTDLPYAGLNNEDFVGCVVPEELHNYWMLLRGLDRQRVPEAIKLVGTMDLCHYDSDKSYSGRMWTYPRLWSALRSGGIFISDDIGDNMGFADFADKVAIKPVIVHSGGKYMGILVKP